MSTLLTELTDLRDQMQRAFEDAVKDGKSSNGIAALGRQVRELVEAIHEEEQRLAREQAAAEDTGPLTDAELVAQAVEELAGLPDPLLDDVLRGLVHAGRGAAMRRCAPPPLRVVGRS